MCVKLFKYAAFQAASRQCGNEVVVIIILKKNADETAIQSVTEKLQEHGYTANVTYGVSQTIVAAIGTPQLAEKELVAPQLEAMEDVAQVLFVSKPYKMVSRESHQENTQFSVGGQKTGGNSVLIGGKKIVMMAGPCSIESDDSLLDIARGVAKSGAQMLRGGAYKPRTSPYDFQGLGVEGLKYLAHARQETGLPVITEVMTPHLVETVCEYADVLQIGARNMQNYDLLREAGKKSHAGFIEARPERDHRRMAQSRRVFAGGRQRASDVLRARHSHFRAEHALHARFVGGSGD